MKASGSTKTSYRRDHVTMIGPRESTAPSLVASIVILFIALSWNTAAQNQYVFPFREGNFLRYRIEKVVQSDTTFMLSFKRPNTDFPTPDLSLDSVIVMRTGPRVLDMKNYSWVKITASGVFISMDSANRFREYLPTFPPLAGTMTLYNTRVRADGVTDTLSENHILLLREFDSTIFGNTTRAFTIEVQKRDQYGLPSIEILTIADGFGIVHIERYDAFGVRVQSASLSGAVIDGSRYNWDPVMRNFLPLCDGNIFQSQLRVIGFWPIRGDTTVIRTDTVRTAGLIDGEEWFLYRNMMLRSEESGVYMRDSLRSRPYKRLFLPAHAEPGCVIGNHKIISATPITLFGEQRMAITLAPFFGEQIIVDGPEEWESWYEGVGINASYIGCHGCMWYPSDDSLTLNYARICGKEYGRLIDGVPNEPPMTDGIVLQQIYPNPLIKRHHRNAIISVSLNKHMAVTLSVYSLCGERIAIVHDGVLPVGTHEIPWDVGDLSAGVYSIILKTERSRLSQMMVVR